MCLSYGAKRLVAVDWVASSVPTKGGGVLAPKTKISARRAPTRPDKAITRSATRPDHNSAEPPSREESPLSSPPPSESSPPHSQNHSSTSSSSSDYNSPIKMATSSSKSKTPAAIVEYNRSHKSPPLLLDGTITFTVLNEWEDHCKSFFTKTKVEADKKVESVIDGLKPILLIHWVENNRDDLIAKSFDDFMKDLRRRSFGANWDDPIIREINSCSQGTTADPDEKFIDFAKRLMGLNSNLRGSDKKLNPKSLKDQLNRGMASYLVSSFERLTSAEKERINNITSFEEWYEEFVKLDSYANAEIERLTNIAISRIQRNMSSQMDEHINKRLKSFPNQSSHNTSTTKNVSATSSSYTNRHRSSSAASNNGSNSTGTSRKRSASGSSRPNIQRPPDYKYPPSLTQEERTILEEHNGCMHCRRVYVSCSSNNCGTLPPDRDQYIPLTDPRSLERIRQKGKSTNSVAATGGDLSCIEEIDDDSIDNKAQVNAVLPYKINFIRGNGTDSESSDSAPSEVSPFTHPHVLWHAIALSNDNKRLPVKCLIDTGAHLNLISPESAADLDLRVQKLRKPVPVSLALHNDPTTPPPVTFLSTFVTIPTLRTVNNVWKSYPVRAVIAPGLCANMLLGTPFEKGNNLMVDVECDQVIDKKSGLDIIKADPDVLYRKITIRKTSISPKAKRLANINAFQEMLKELKVVTEKRRLKLQGYEHGKPGLNSFVATIKSTIQLLEVKEQLKELGLRLKSEFSDVFEAIPHASLLPDSVQCRIKLKDANLKLAKRTYSCPKQYKEAFEDLIKTKVDQGFIRLNNDAQFASPSFLVPKPDNKFRWVVDYRALNANTVPDNYPMPKVADILADCGKGKIWSVIDMTESFFQTRMHPKDIHKTAVSTPIGIYEWLVMPMGFRNSPAIHQRRVNEALRELIGKICHIYLDDIVIWSQNAEEHEAHIRLVLEALRKAKLYVNPKKTHLFQSEIKFLGHIISQRGIEADGSKVDKILEWPTPKSASEVRQFLGLVRYIAAFLPKLAIQCTVLNRLTTKECNKKFPTWNEAHQHAFDSIKQIVVSRECLTVVDHSKLDENKIFVTTDASDRATGAVLSFGPSWETARPVAFDSQSLKDAELNYPVHEKELLAIIKALKKWKTDLIGAPFLVYTDHKTLLNFNTQKDLSRRQARWMEFLSIYDCKFVYVKGEDNSVADALSRYPSTLVTGTADAEDSSVHPYNDSKPSILTLLQKPTHANPLQSINALTSLQESTPATAQIAINKSKSTLSIDDDFIAKIKAGYESDSWFRRISKTLHTMTEFTVRDGLWYLNERLLIPDHANLRESIFRMAHDKMGHFGFFKSYALIADAYFWPGMRRDLEEGYIPSCFDCQRNKSPTQRKRGPLHSLPVPDERCMSIAMDFIEPLPEDKGFTAILTITDRLNSDIRILPVRHDLSAKDLASIFFKEWYCENGLPRDVISDRDKLFMAKFWKHLTILTGIKHKASTAYHPQTDGVSERSNKTVLQAIRMHVKRNQRNWVDTLPWIRFQIMSTKNKSTGFSPFMLRFGREPLIIPPLPISPPNQSPENFDAAHFLEEIRANVQDARDNLLLAKISQTYHANKTRRSDFPYKVDDLVLLNTINRRYNAAKNDDHKTAKFMSRFEGPYRVTDCNPSSSTVTLSLPNTDNSYPVFHSSLIKPFIPNDNSRYPDRARPIEPQPPAPVEVDGEMEYFVDKIIDHRYYRNQLQFLVSWKGFDDSHNEWFKYTDVADNEALDVYLHDNNFSMEQLLKHNRLTT
ncbi:hypothetical protein CVT24_001968 [Panaeolus cyanescens]|uniref:RNA-directed DNA polymerase n=1 Tax=Panaeolus cyanescens TaxID=181874 RepID=A0A409YHP1_9AGAR|nr:hypothetical protein CVT24_001968 [Panaeolus cyanescens]